MQYRMDPKTGNRLPILGYGCMRFPKSFEKTEELIVKAVEKGVCYLDTAYIYLGSEETLGKIIAKNNLRDRVYIATKMPIVLCRGASDFDKFFEKQLARLKTEKIDYYLVHMLTSLADWRTLQSWGIEEWIKKEKAKGRIGQIGFSFHGVRDEFMKLLDAYPWEFCQIQYNYADENYQAGVAGLKKAAAKGMPVFIMEPLLGGKLANGLPKEAVGAFREEEPDCSPAVWALKWLWDQPEVTVVLSGMNHVDQLEENVKAAEASFAGMITARERAAFARVKRIFDDSFKVKCTGCNYCMPCPHHVNIPACFAAYNASYALGFYTGMQQYTTSTGGTSRQQHYASLCKKCGKCEKHCPQHLEIMKSLEQVRKRLEIPGYKGALFLLRKLMRKN